MDRTTLSINLDVELEGEHVRGRASDPRGGSLPFVGWLGLIAALDALIAAAPATDQRSPR
jgi:hypothetical protein